MKGPFCYIFILAFASLATFAADSVAPPVPIDMFEQVLKEEMGSSQAIQYEQAVEEVESPVEEKPRVAKKEESLTEKKPVQEKDMHRDRRSNDAPIKGLDKIIANRTPDFVPIDSAAPVKPEDFEKALQAEMARIPDVSSSPTRMSPLPLPGTEPIPIPVSEIEKGDHSLSLKTNRDTDFVQKDAQGLGGHTAENIPVEAEPFLDVESLRRGNEVDLSSIGKSSDSPKSESFDSRAFSAFDEYRLPPIFMEEAISSEEIAALYEVTDAEFIMTWASFSTTLRKFLGLCEYMETSIRRGASRDELYQHLDEMNEYWEILVALTWPPDEFHQRGHYSHIVKSWDLYLWSKALTETFTEPPYHRNLYYYNMALEVGHHTADWNPALAYLMQSRFMSDPEVFRLCAIHLLKDAQENLQVYMKPGHKLPRRVLIKRKNNST